MIRQRTVSAEEEYAAKVMNDGITAEGGTTGLQDLLNFKAEDAPIDTESDDEVLGLDFSENKEPSTATTIIRNDSDAVKK